MHYLILEKIVLPFLTNWKSNSWFLLFYKELKTENVVINGKNIKRGDVLVGFASNGLHTNGYSLARKILLEKHKLPEKIDGLELPLGEELLRIHKSYLKLILKLKKEIPVKGFSHVTGGGIIGNTKRILPEDLSLKINWNAWEVPALFRFIQTEGKISDDEMRKVFNIGIGLIAVVDKNDAEKAVTISKQFNETPLIIGEVV